MDTIKKHSLLFGTFTGFLFSLSFLGFSLHFVDSRINWFNMIFLGLMFLALTSSWTYRPLIKKIHKKEIKIDELVELKAWRKGVAAGVIFNFLAIMPYNVSNFINNKGDVFISSFGQIEAIFLAIILLSSIFIFKNKVE